MSRISIAMLAATLLLTLFPVTTVQAQDARLDAEELGIDKTTFERLFIRASQTGAPVDPRDRVDSLRVFADRELARQGRVRVELRGEALEDQKTLRLPLGDAAGGEAVIFNDLGEGADREPGDGVFTGTVPLRLGDFLARNLRGQGRVEMEREVPRFSGREVVTGQRRPDLERPGVERPEIDPRQQERAQRLRELASRLPQLSNARVIRALDLSPEDPLLEVIRKGRFLEERLLGLPLRLFASVAPGDVDPDRSLMITDVGVVEDSGRTFDPCGPGGNPIGNPGGPWTFGHLMREMSTGSGMTPEDFTLLWLNTWQTAQVANGFLVNDPGRGMQLQNRVITPWINSSGGTPDVDRFPARLMAIVNRPDLADQVGYSAPGTGGEGRLVFGLLDPSTCQSLPFTVIFEYRVPVSGCSDLKAWHQQWKDLDNHAVGSAAYNAALEAITRQFTDHGSDPSQVPNQNALGQLRTNENALDPLWELREFTLQGPGSSSPGALGLVTVKQTPDFSFNNNATLSAFIMNNQADILADQHVVPLRFPTVTNPFLGANSPTPFGVFWEAPGVLGQPDGPELVHKVSLATCSGCHAGETDTFFTHIGTTGRRSPGSPAFLSDFLTGNNMPKADPRVPGINRTFNDLARRQQNMAEVLNRTCFSLVLGPRLLPPVFVH